MKTADTQAVLKTLAFYDAADRALQGETHGSKIAKLPAESWQAGVIRSAADTVIVSNPAAMRAALADPDTVVIFVPATAVLTPEFINRACTESALDKTIILETAG